MFFLLIQYWACWGRSGSGLITILYIYPAKCYVSGYDKSCVSGYEASDLLRIRLNNNFCPAKWYRTGCKIILQYIPSNVREPDVKIYYIWSNVTEPDVKLNYILSNVTEPDVKLYYIRSNVTKPDVKLYYILSNVTEPDVKLYYIRLNVTEPDVKLYYSRRGRNWNTHLLVLQPPWLSYQSEKIFWVHMYVSREDAENLRKIRWLFCRWEPDEWRLPRGRIHYTSEDRWQGETVFPGGHDAQEAGCHDQEHWKHNKVLGHRPPHTKRRFLFKKIISLPNKQKQSCRRSVQFSTASTVYPSQMLWNWM